MNKIFFTSPWDPVAVRRGDALGLRAVTDQFAEAVAPSLTNRTNDGRWISILAWCLSRSHEVFHASGGRSLTSREEQQYRYGWLQPLELMWVARTIGLTNDWETRPLNGRRSIAPWYREEMRKSDRFGMTPKQLAAYRQTGLYGGYRLGFRRWPGMTQGGDGWTPGTNSRELAHWIDDRLKGAQPSWRLFGSGDDQNLSNTAKRGRENKRGWWLSKWGNFDQGWTSADTQTLPRPRDEFLLLPEAALLEDILFAQDSEGIIRRNVASAIAKSKATTHIEICEYLALSFPNQPLVEALPRFSRLADAGMLVMDFIAQELGGETKKSLSAVVDKPETKTICANLYEAARTWQSGKKPDSRHIESVTTFAEAIPSSKPEAVFRRILEHHEQHGGGLRWFVLRGNDIEAKSPVSLGSSRYRFRFWALSRLAIQSGVVSRLPLDVRHALAGGDSEEEVSDE